MSRTIGIALATAGFGLAALAAALPASAQSANRQNCTSPPGMNYMICDGQRVPKPTNRVANDDGSWREEYRQGNCLVIKEKTPTGEYRETRRCD